MNPVSTILAWLQGILGQYEPVTYEVTSGYMDSQDVLQVIQNDIIPSGLAGVNWEYVVTAAFLLVVVYSAFRLLGVLLQGLIGGRRV